MNRNQRFCEDFVKKSKIVLPALPSVPSSLPLLVDKKERGSFLGTIRPENGRKLYLKIGTLGLEHLSNKEYNQIEKGYRDGKKSLSTCKDKTEVEIEVQNVNLGIDSTKNITINEIEKALPPEYHPIRKNSNLLNVPLESPKRLLKVAEKFEGKCDSQEYLTAPLSPTTPSKVYQRFCDEDICMTPNNENSDRCLASHAMLCLSSSPKKSRYTIQNKQELPLMSPLDSNLSFLAHAATLPDIPDTLCDLFFTDLAGHLQSKGVSSKDASQCQV